MGGVDAQRHVVVVGGGICRAGRGLVPAPRRPRRADLRSRCSRASPQIGGKLRVSEVGGVPVDEGAESLLLRRPEAVDLAAAVGLGDDLVDAGDHDGVGLDAAAGCVRCPPGTVMGMPADLRALAAQRAAHRAGAGPRAGSTPGCPRPAGGRRRGRHGTSRRRLGRAVVDRLVEPLLGGVYAGPGRPAVAGRDHARSSRRTRAGERSLLAAAAGSRAASTPRPTARTAGLRQPRAAASAGCPAAVARGVGGRRCGLGADGPRAAPHARRLAADGRLDPAPGAARAPTPWCSPCRPRPAARLLRADAPAAGDRAGRGSRTPSMAVVTLAFPGTAFPRPPPGPGSWCRRSTAGRSRR